MAKRGEVLEKAFGQVPKEVCWNGFFTYVEKPPHMLKMLYLKIVRSLKFK
jgi:hypothetical protein